MNKRIALLGLIAVAMIAHGSASAAPLPTEGVLRAQLRSVVWPDDIVRLSDEYLRRFPKGPVAADAARRSGRAALARNVLQTQDVQLFRTAFVAVARVPALRRDVERAALADAEAALRIAHALHKGPDAPADADRYVGWLQFASSLGNGEASYELALHYRRSAQMPPASRYEARAVEQGFQPPPALDHVRK
ncbi:MAG: hypothetical protein ACKVQR_15815 [Aquabacterium sp.]